MKVPRWFWLTLLATIPLVVASETVMNWFGYSIDFPGIALVGSVLGSLCSGGAVGPSSPAASPSSATVSPG